MVRYPPEKVAPGPYRVLRIPKGTILPAPASLWGSSEADANAQTSIMNRLGEQRCTWWKTGYEMEFTEWCTVGSNYPGAEPHPVFGEESP